MHTSFNCLAYEFVKRLAPKTFFLRGDFSILELFYLGENKVKGLLFLCKRGTRIELWSMGSIGQGMVVGNWRKRVARHEQEKQKLVSCKYKRN